MRACVTLWFECLHLCPDPSKTAQTWYILFNFLGFTLISSPCRVTGHAQQCPYRLPVAWASNTHAEPRSVSSGCTLFFYESDGRSGIDHNSIPKHAVWVENSIVQAVPEHPKKDFVFCLSNSLGDAFLFQVGVALPLQSISNLIPDNLPLILFPSGWWVLSFVHYRNKNDEWWNKHLQWVPGIIEFTHRPPQWNLRTGVGWRIFHCCLDIICVAL